MDNKKSADDSFKKHCVTERFMIFKHFVPFHSGKYAVEHLWFAWLHAHIEYVYSVDKNSNLWLSESEFF